MIEQINTLKSYNTELTTENQKISNERLELDKKFNKMTKELLIYKEKINELQSEVKDKVSQHHEYRNIIRRMTTSLSMSPTHQTQAVKTP